MRSSQYKPAYTGVKREAVADHAEGSFQPAAKEAKLPPKEDAFFTKEGSAKVMGNPKTTGEEEEDANNCSICLDDFVITGHLNTCSHIFCFDCIKLWSETENSCPLCKAKFNEITKRDPADLDERGKAKEHKVRVGDKSQTLPFGGAHSFFAHFPGNDLADLLNFMNDGPPFGDTEEEYFRILFDLPPMAARREAQHERYRPSSTYGRVPYILGGPARYNYFFGNSARNQSRNSASRGEGGGAAAVAEGPGLRPTTGFERDRTVSFGGQTVIGSSSGWRNTGSSAAPHAGANYRQADAVVQQMVAFSRSIRLPSFATLSEIPRRGQPSAPSGVRPNSNGSNNDSIGSSASNPVVLDDDSEDEVEILEAGSDTSRNSTARSPRPSSPAVSPPPLVRPLRSGTSGRLWSGAPAPLADDNGSGHQDVQRDAPNPGRSRLLPHPRCPPARSRLRAAPLPPAPSPWRGLPSSFTGLMGDETLGVPDWMPLGERELDAMFFDASDSESDDDEEVPPLIALPQVESRVQAGRARMEQANPNRSSGTIFTDFLQGITLTAVPGNASDSPPINRSHDTSRARRRPTSDFFDDWANTTAQNHSLGADEAHGRRHRNAILELQNMRGAPSSGPDFGTREDATPFPDRTDDSSTASPPRQRRRL